MGKSATTTMSGRVSLAALRVGAGCFVGVLLAGSLQASFSVFLLPVTGEFGWGRGLLSGAYLFSTVITALCYPFVGNLLDRYGTRPVLAVALVLHAFGIMGLALLDGSHSRLFALYALFGLGAALSGYLAYVRLIVGWFHERKGLALGLILGLGAAIGTSLSPQVARILIEHFGWRSAYVLIGLPFILIGLPNLLLLREPPIASAVMKDGQRRVAPGLSGSDARRTATFWLLVVAFFLFTTAWEGPREHMIALLHDRGETVKYASSILSLTLLCTAMGRAFEGYLLDVFRTPRIGVLSFLMAFAGLVMIDHGTGYVVVAGAIVLGLGVGSERSVMAYFVSRYFGMRSYGELYAIMLSVVTISGGVGPFLMGVLFDRLGNYQMAFMVVEALLLIAVIPIFLLRPYLYDVRSSEVSGAQHAPATGAQHASPTLAGAGTSHE